MSYSITIELLILLRREEESRGKNKKIRDLHSKLSNASTIEKLILLKTKTHANHIKKMKWE